MLPGPPPPNFILFQLDFDVKFPLLRLLLFLIDLKSTIVTSFTISNRLKKYFSLQRKVVEMHQFYKYNKNIFTMEIN